MGNLSPYQRATKWYFLLIGTVVFLIGAFGVYYAIQEAGSFNAGGVYIFGFFAILGIVGLFLSHHTASKFRKELPEGDNETGLQPNYMNKEMQRMEFRKLPALILGIIGMIGLMISNQFESSTITIQVFISCILIGVGLIGLQAYKYELYVIYPSKNIGGVNLGGWIRHASRGKEAKKKGIILASISVLGLIFVWIILPFLV